MATTSIRSRPFLDMGFDSLSLAKVAARLSEFFEVEVLAPDIFAHPSAAVLSGFLALNLRDLKKGGVGAGKVSSLIGSAGRNVGILPPSLAQRCLWFLVQLEEGASRPYNVPVGLRLRGRRDRRALRRAVDRIVWRHQSLRTRFVTADGVTVQEIVREGVGFALQE